MENKASGKKANVVYVLRTVPPGGALSPQVTMPDGTIIREVDEALHQRALANASRHYRETLNGG